MLPYWIRKCINSKKTVITAVLVVVFLLFTFFVFTDISPAYAQAEGDALGVEAVEESGLILGGGDIRIVIARIIRAVLGLLGIIAFAIVAYGGFVYMTSGGNEEKISRAKKILINGGIGLAIILSSLAITQFVLSSLQRATGAFPGAGEGISRPTFQTFSGSGSLGRVVQDHYPDRNQTDVKRNSKISVTFREPIDPASIIIDSNQNGVLGDCQPAEDRPLDWGTDCDQINQQAARIYTSGEGEPALLAAAALTTYESDGSAYTFVFRPLDILDSELWYTVDLTARILKLDGESAFSNERSDHYLWEFQTGDSADFEPPHVVRVYPRPDREVARNTILRIDFSEAMDPTVVQGLTENFFNILMDVNEGQGELPAGQWKISNNYRTVEFVSSDQCGVNSCGDVMYCLPVYGCDIDDSTCLNNYSVLIRTAQTIEQDTFEAVPFTGVMDMAGNALDGNNDSVVDGKPNVSNPSAINEAELIADNYWWSFSVRNDIDRSIPHIESVLPSPESENVPANAPVIVSFNKEMWSSSFVGVLLEEYPANYCLPDEPENCLDDIWFATYSEITADGKTDLYITHREFGANNLDLFYFPTVPSTVKSLNQQCVYPGRGPAGTAACEVVEDDLGVIISTNNCVPVSFDEETDTACAQSLDPDAAVVSSNEQCLEFYRSLVP